MYLSSEHKIWIGTGDLPVYFEPSMANRHGLIAGATGTGKTVTLKVLAEAFSDMRVPVFMADIKGDLSGMCNMGTETRHIRRSIDSMALTNFSYSAYHVQFWDVYGRQGLPIRTTVSSLGPDMLSRLLLLTDIQSGVLRIIFRIADDKQMLLIDLKDLRSMLKYVGDNASEFRTDYGNITPQTIGAIQRALLRLEDEGGDVFFGEPALELGDFIKWSENDGRGMMNLLECSELFQNPLLYSTFLLWMLTELYELLPEAGDLDKPKLAFFFDEAHLLFDDAPKALVDKVEQVVRLIRSKGVSVWFITQNPTDIPESVLSQIGNRVQHALRAYTPKEQKALRAAARSFRVNPNFDTEAELQTLGVGEALISVLDIDGVPTVVEKAKILPPRSSMNAASADAITDTVKNSRYYDKYAKAVDRESAYEILSDLEATEAAKEKKETASRSSSKKGSSRTKKSATEKFVDSAASSFGRSIGNKIVRGIFGNIKF